MRESLHLVEESGEGYYAVAARRDEPELRDAIDRAIARLAERGELRRILARWQIDSERQARLVSWTDDDTRAMVRTPGRASFGTHHGWLFVQGAAVTLVVSAAAMGIAIVLGLVLALARQYGPRAVAAPATLYVEVFRGTPVLLQLYLLYFGIMPSVRHALSWRAPSTTRSSRRSWASG